jgi:hypothetical protein
MKKVLLANGDSWTFGSEIMAPEFCVPAGTKGTGMAGRYKEGYNDWAEYNDYYRLPRIWPSYLANKLNIPEVVNIARPARSNDTIYDTTVSWILENYISKGKSTDDLLVVIGWSSPERKNIIIGDSGIDNDSVTWLTLWPQMTETKFYSSPVIRQIFKFYVTHQSIEQEYLKRFVEQNYHLQNFCKLHNIEYYFFNAFYASFAAGPDNWQDVNVSDAINSWNHLSNGWADSFYNWDTIKTSLLTQWNFVDEKRFINKNSGSFRSYIYKNVPADIRMCNWHPSPESHEAWATFLADYIECT